MLRSKCQRHRRNRARQSPPPRSRRLKFEQLECRALLAGDGPALLVDGIDDYASVPDNPTLDLGVGLNDDFTIEASFIVPTSVTGQRTLVLVDKPDAYTLYVTINPFGSDTIGFTSRVAPGNSITLTKFSELAPGWHHAAGVFDNEFTPTVDRLALYSDGTLANNYTSFDWIPGIWNSSAPVFVGGGSLSTYIDGVRLSSNVRYSASTYMIPTGSFGTDPNARAIWNFNEAPGNTVFSDASVSGNTLFGFNGARTGDPSNVGPTVVDVVDVVPDPRTFPVSTIDVVFSEPINIGTFTYQDLELRRDGNLVPLNPSVFVSQVGGATYRIFNLEPFTAASGAYLLKVSASNIADTSGALGTGEAFESWSKTNPGPTVLDVIDVVPDPRTTPVSTADVLFSEPVDLTTFTYHDVTLTRDGVPVSLGPQVSTAQVSGNVYRISGLDLFTAPSGSYVLTVNGSGIADTEGALGTGEAFDIWSMMNPGPTVIDVTDVAPDPRTTSVSSVDVVFSEPLNLTTFTWQDMTLTRDGVPVPLDVTVMTALVSGNTYRMSGLDSFTAPSGSYVLTVNGSGIADTEGALGTGEAFDIWSMTNPGPTVIDVTDVAPDPRTTPVSSVDVVFSEPVNLTTFTWQDATLTRDGVPVPLDATVMTALVSGNTYRISGLESFTTAAGVYELTVNASGIQDEFGSSGSGSASDAWSVFVPLGSIGGHVFEDANNDGAHQPEEPPLEGWPVLLAEDGEFLYELPHSPNIQEYFGASLTAANGRVMVGAHGTRKVFVYDETTSQLIRTLDQPTIGGFGVSMAAVGDQVLVGAHSNDFFSGVAFIYDVPTGLVMHTIPNPSPSPQGDLFGASTGVMGNNFLVGAVLDSDDGYRAGAAYLFDGATGGLLRRFGNPALDPTDDQFGTSLAVLGNSVFMGALDGDSAGLVGVVYMFDAATGNLVRTFNSPSGDLGQDFFGFSIAVVGGQYLLVGGPHDEVAGENAGAAYLFDIATGQLVQTYNTPISKHSSFGASVAAAGENAVLIGANGSYFQEPYVPGRAYVFDALSGRLLQVIEEPNPGENDVFANVVASFNGKAYISDPVNGDADLGAVFVFDLPMQSQVVSTAVDGSYEFADLAAGEYHVVSRLFPGTFTTTPSMQQISLAPGATVISVDFLIGNPPIPGDVNGDGIVNIFDVNLISAHWGESGPLGDANHDGTVDIFDVNLVSANWGNMSGGGGAATSAPLVMPQSLVVDQPTTPVPDAQTLAGTQPSAPGMRTASENRGSEATPEPPRKGADNVLRNVFDGYGTSPRWDHVANEGTIPAQDSPESANVDLVRRNWKWNRQAVIVFQPEIEQSHRVSALRVLSDELRRRNVAFDEFYKRHSFNFFNFYDFETEGVVARNTGPRRNA